MQNLLSDNYFPFGSQYYRAPSPHKDEWEKDLKNMAALGFNTVKFWVQWRWNNPKEHEFYFDDIDELMNLAHKYNLKVMLNTIFDVAPAWIYNKFPDASMITLSGKKIGPQTQPHRQIGGLGYCFNHNGVMSHFYEFLSETIKRYKDHPALEIWNVGSEPELTSSMAEMRAYADNSDKMDDMLCYCNNCKIKFRKWVVEKYNGLENLNTAWNRNYRSIEEIELPKTRNTFNDIIDWRMFFVDTIGENVKKRFEVTRDIDEGKHPLMCHHVFIQGFPVVSTASDPWNVGRFGDLHGFTQMDDPMMIDILRSCAKGKPVISAEMLMLMGYTLDLPRNIDDNDIKRLIFSGIAGNLKGFVFWQYRPEILGREAPTWGLTHLDGGHTKWMKSYSEVGKVLQKHAEFLMNAKPVKAEVAMIYNPENQIFAWASTGNEKTATDSLLGYHRALYNKNYVMDFIHPMEFTKELLSNYKVILYPFPYILNEKLAGLLIEWVNNGGVLIAESYFGGWNLDKGHHEKIVPGYGFEKVFGVKQDIVHPVKKENDCEIIPAVELPFLRADSVITGAIIKETYKIYNAKTLALFKTGEAAVTVSSYGKGKAIQIGSYIGLNFQRMGIEANGNLIASLVEHSALVQRPKITNGSPIRVDLLMNENTEVLLIIRNLTEIDIEDEIILHGINKSKLIEQFGKNELNMVLDGESSKAKVKLSAKEVLVYFG
ncbi:MAG: beta-galactosidase [Bacteroidota bacterium]